MENNPLKQYFRRPAVYLKLPSEGKGYAEGVIEIPESGEIPIYPMTAIDEITARTPDALFNGTAVADLIRSCVPSIKNPWQINSNDLDAVLIGIKAASDTEPSVDSVCPSCGELGTYGVNLIAMLSTLKSGDYETEMETGELKIKFRPLTYKEMNDAALFQFELQKTFATIDQTEDAVEREKLGKDALEKITLLTMDLITKSIERIDAPNFSVTESEFVLDFLKNCDRNIYVAVREHNTKLKTDAELKPMTIVCASCGHSYEQPYSINPADFFA